VGEQVRSGCRHRQPGLGQRLPELGDPLIPLSLSRAEVEHVVVMEIDAVGTQLGQLADGPVGCHRRAHRRAEHVCPLPSHRPDAE